VATLLEHDFLVRELQIKDEMLEISRRALEEFASLNAKLERANRNLEIKSGIQDKQLEIREEQIKALKLSTGEKLSYIGKGTILGSVLTVLAIIFIK
jgi:hypothetical protein